MSDNLIGLDGKPLNPKITDEQIKQIFTIFNARIRALEQQTIYSGFYTEYLTRKITEIVPNFEIDVDEFNKWAEQEHKRLQEIAKQQEEEQTSPNVPKVNINLNE